MDLNAWQKNWDELGKDDPLWVVLTDPAKKGGRWQPEEFFQTGIEEINGLLAKLATLKPALPRSRALDFGCGVGRLTQALAGHFTEVHGVDISPSMIGHANRFNRQPEKCTYHVNPENNLALFPANHFDLIYSSITLQHIEPRFAKNYIREFVRVLKPGGVAAFQFLQPSFIRSLVPDAAAMAWRKFKFGQKPFIGMFGMKDREISRLVHQSGASTLTVIHSDTEHARWANRQYFITKP